MLLLLLQGSKFQLSPRTSTKTVLPDQWMSKLKLLLPLLLMTLKINQRSKSTTSTTWSGLARSIISHQIVLGLFSDSVVGSTVVRLLAYQMPAQDVSLLIAMAIESANSVATSFVLVLAEVHTEGDGGSNMPKRSQWSPTPIQYRLQSPCHAQVLAAVSTI